MGKVNKRYKKYLTLKGRLNTMVAVVFILSVVIVFSTFLGGIWSRFPQTPKSNRSSADNILVTLTPGPGGKKLQINTFNMITVTPGPPLPTKSPYAICDSQGVNSPVPYLLAYPYLGDDTRAPSPQIVVGKNDLLKIWLNDKKPACVATGMVTNQSGDIVTYGAVSENNSDGYLWAPALYIDPYTARNPNPTPYFPQKILGTYNNGSKSGNPGNFYCDAPENIDSYIGPQAPNSNWSTWPTIEPLPASGNWTGSSTTNPPDAFRTEYIWDMSRIPLSPGVYRGEVVVRDGEKSMAVVCIGILVE